MIRLLSVVLSVAVAAPAFAASAKEKDCGLQADVVGAVQAARLGSVNEADVVTHLADSAPAWPENYNAVVPLVTPWIYGLDISEVKENDLSAAWNELCLAQ